MKSEEAIEKLYALTKELKESYLQKLKTTSNELLNQLHVNNEEGVKKIREIAKVAIDEFQKELQKVSNSLEEKMKVNHAELNQDIDKVSKESEEKIREGFSGIFERVYKHIKNLFSVGDKS